ncbi:DUF4105 domain-containing protein [Rubritalea sp.]|uniref:lipoprotein N-acyltransferase Lnb domain-containing protein n=1 Tax=Rubritalea sp. TaxID=2109375 RepID=UPI003EF3EAFB
MSTVLSIQSNWLKKLLRVFSNILVGFFILYFFGAIFYDGPLGQANIWNALVALIWVSAFFYLWRKMVVRWKKLLVALVGCLLVIIPWSFIKPSNEKPWTVDFEKTGWVEIEGEIITFYNFRDFDYPMEVDGKWGIDPVWRTKTVHLSKLQGMDIFHDRFLGNFMAHPILSFDFGEDGRVCLSVETRREVGEVFSPIGGLYKMFELQYIFTAETDAIRVRTNVREEPVFLYKSALSIEKIRYLFLSSVVVQNELKESPQFYNVLNANCTTSIRNQFPSSERSPFDIRMLVNGLLDEYLYEKGVLETDGLSYEELRDACQINTVAEDAHSDPRFSSLIREGRPGQ